MEFFPIQKAKGIKVSDQVFNALKHNIETMQWTPGDRLPSEDYLAESFAVSRVSVRAAIKKLEALDLVETQNGGGTYVKKFSFSDVLNSVSSLITNTIAYEDVQTFRRIIEPGFYEVLRNKRIPSAEMQKLKKIFLRMEAAAHVQDKEAFAAVDFDFHMQICRMGGNNMLIYAYEMAQSVMRQYFRSHYDHLSRRPQQNHPSEFYFNNALLLHQRIMDCLESGDIDTCISLTETMV